jgi:LPXTG-site transpeptidase (sortase) family protein
VGAAKSGVSNASARSVTRKAAHASGIRLARQRWERSLIEIPSIGVEAVVVPAVGSWRWLKGPAYDPRSAGPGGPGNPVIAAHRNMWARTFEQLPRVKPGDRVYIRTHTHRYTYVVQWARPVSTSNRTVLANTKTPSLTLYTCVLPFRADRRFVVRGRLESAQPLVAASTANAANTARLASGR